MTNEKAHNWLENRQRMMTNNRWAFESLDIEANGLAILALEKQIPRKPTHEATIYRNLTCPNCKNVIDEFIKFNGEKVRVLTNFCKYCGQAIDWSEGG